MKKKQIYCNHRLYAIRHDALLFDPETKYCTCQKCNAVFKPMGVDDIKNSTEIRESLDQLDDLLNTLKLLAYGNQELMDQVNKQCKAAYKLRKLPKLVDDCCDYSTKKPNALTCFLTKLPNPIYGGQCPSQVFEPLGMPYSMYTSMDQNLPGYVAAKEHQASLLNTFPGSYSKEDIEKITKEIKTEKKEEE